MKGRRSLGLAALLAASLATAAADRAAAQTQLSACGSLTKGSYKLTRNLNATGHCLTLLNNFTTIDLNGFVITGDGGEAAYGIRMSPAAPSPIGIEIRNGTITNFWSAIYLPNTSGVVVERVRAVRNITYGMLLGENCVVGDNVAAENRGSGVVGTSSCVASGNSASNNDGNGLFADDGLTAIGNATFDNALNGIRDRQGSGSTIVNNSSRSNGEFGIRVACPSNVVENTATVNFRGNIDFDEGSGCGDNFNVVDP